MTNCHALRCIPDLVSGYGCQVDDDCYDGQVCDGAMNLCVACDTNGGTTEAATYYSDGACHQPFTNETYASYAAGESGCAGDHCRHSCAYDTQCVRILNSTAQLDVTATHNQLPKVLTVTDVDREVLMRPSTCRGNDAGGDESGMRCARTIHRVITSKERTPEEIRDRNLDTVELSVMKNGGDDVYENFVQFDDDDVANRALEITQEGGRGYSIGYIIPEEGDARTEDGTTIGTGSLIRKS